MGFVSRLKDTNIEVASHEPIAKKREGQLAVDVFETNEDVMIVAPIAGVSLDGIEISIAEDILTIKGERKVPENLPAGVYHTQECFWGSFARSIILPTAVETNKITASFKDGILKVKVPKHSSVMQKTIKITLE